MKKMVALFAASLSAVLFAEEPRLVLFSDDVPRYTGFALGAFATNQYGISDWSDFAKATLGVGIDAEYTLPSFLHKNLDMGFSLHADYAHIFPKKESTLKRDDDISTSLGVWIRVPFLAFGQRFAFLPELGYGVIFPQRRGASRF